MGHVVIGRRHERDRFQSGEASSGGPLVGCIWLASAAESASRPPYMLALSASAHVALTVAFGLGDEDGIAPLSGLTKTVSSLRSPTRTPQPPTNIRFAASRPLVSNNNFVTTRRQDHNDKPEYGRR